jgi:hypothetical protein
MKEATLETITPLINFLRSYDVLEEAGDSKFLLKGRDFIHFHDDPDGLWADAILSKGRVRVSVSSASEQGDLMEKIAKRLDTLISHNGHGKKRSTRRNERGA